MTDTNDPRRLLQAVMAITAGYDRRAGDRALDLLGSAGAAHREELHSWLLAFAIEFRLINLGEIARPRGREIVDALSAIVKGAEQIDAGLTVLRRARQTAIQGRGDADDYRLALFPLTVSAIQRSFQLNEAEWLGGFEDPLTGAFGQMAGEVKEIASRFSVDDVAGPARVVHPALVQAVGQLGELYEQETGKKPSASRTGDRPDYQVPFERFVQAVTSILGIDPPPTAAVIGRALKLYHVSSSNLVEKRGTDRPADPCHLSVHQHETARDDDHEK